jgi:hypothetical protein
MLSTLLVIPTLMVLYWFPLRRWFGRWGTTDEDLTRVMAGDAAVVEPTYGATLAITIDARPEHIWPWRVQLGYRRGGLYSYDWLDRLFGYLDRPYLANLRSVPPSVTALYTASIVGVLVIAAWAWWVDRHRAVG